MSETPQLVYDGDCRFCCSWVDYWFRQTGSSITYSPYQQVAENYGDVTVEQFRRHIQFFDPQGTRFQGAAAAFQVLRRVPGKGYWWWLYRHVPGFSRCSEWIYDRVAQHRRLAFTVQKVLWGATLQPDHCHRVSWLFLRLLALIYLAAFISFGSQAPGLIGDEGLLPVSEYIAAVRQQGFPIWKMPTLFWWWQSDTAIGATCLAGCIASLLLFFDRLRLACLIFLYLAYLSLCHAGQEFMRFQWDLLLLETGFLAIFLGAGRLPVVWLFRLLLFRFVFLSGAVKLLSGDPTWADLVALQYHFETQPLPTVLAWYAHQFPDWILQALTLATLVIELLLPLLYLLPRRPRMAGAWGLIALQVSILLTGNYNFFNLLTLVLCLFLFDDHALRWLPLKFPSRRKGRSSLPKKLSLAALFAFIFTLGVAQTWLTFSRDQAPQWLHSLARFNEPWHWVNAYGLFAVMTTQRPEIIIEGSADGATWQPYELPHKPGNPQRTPGWNIPHQPRLDWQLWFAALQPERHPRWMRPLMVHLLFNSESVIDLFDDIPFADTPPRYVRARLYLYNFASPEHRDVSDDWWQRRELGIYFPPAYFKMEVMELPRPE